MSDAAHQLVAQLDESGREYVLGWMSSVLDLGKSFTAEDLVEAVAAYRARTLVPRPRVVS